MILVIDNYDSFTHNLVQYLGELGADVAVRRNDAIGVDEIARMKPSGIVLSPGPCTPGESGVCRQISRAALEGVPGLAGVPLLGVCLGHQTIADVAGGTVERAGRIMHGKTSPIRHDGKGVFRGLPDPFAATRYHSLVVRKDSIPEGFEACAWSEDDGEVMGIRHRTLPIAGIQFHPESVLTPDGKQLIQNYVEDCSGTR